MFDSASGCYTGILHVIKVLRLEQPEDEDVELERKQSMLWWIE